MSINQIRLYDLFRKELRLPDDKAAALVIAVGDVIGSEADNRNHLLATKEDIHTLKEDIHSLELKVGSDIHSLELKIRGDIHSLEHKVGGDIHSLEHKVGGDIHS